MPKNKTILIIFFALAVYVAMGIYADISQLTIAMQSFGWPYFILLLFFTSAGYFLRYLKWDIFLKKAGVDLPFRQSFFVFISGLSMIITPGKLGEVWKAWLIRDISGDDLNRTVPVVIMDRMTDVLSLVILSAFGIFSYKEGIYLLTILFFMVLTFCIAITSKSISEKVIGIIEKKAMKYSGNIKNIHEVFQGLLEPKTFISLSLLNALAWFCECLGFYFIVIGFDQHLTIPLSVFIFSFASLAGGVSMVPGGIGLAEVTITGFLQHYGFNPAIATGTTLIVRLGSFWYGVVLGLAVYLLFRKKIIPNNGNRLNED
ncbi:lysylphosphatidylglycerol synthase transmembrane domain-containing protein [Methanomethylovorans sp.]|uniref:lysylphosphatidylglycerol synthase transmembrane domain-containing protein n=1 Tax=Methanomethylovorans sp. TaxID=2758717 RepID=UPI000AB76D5E|nr:lysylphosphatidylglycerol synthase transmembrane domain-containing protein [Methanomethylovorans sp.]